MQEPLNPYAPPLEDASPAPAEPCGYGLASLPKRLGGRVIDNVLAYGAVRGALEFDPYQRFPWLARLYPAGSELLTDLFDVLFALACMMPLLLLQWTLVTLTGQSIGKKLLRTRVVKEDGSPCGFTRGVLRREGFILALDLVPFLDQALHLFDALVIFAGSRQTLHDRAAGTIVVDLSKPLVFEDLEVDHAPRIRLSRRRARREPQAPAAEPQEADL